MGKTSGMTGKTSGRSGKMRKTSRVFPVFASRCHGSHVFPIFLEMLGKSSLPCLCLRCWGKTCLPCLSRDVREDTWGCWGSSLMSSPIALSVFPNVPVFPNISNCLPQHPQMSSPTSRGRQGRHVFPNISGKDREDLTSPTSQGRQGRHDFPNISRKILKTCLPRHLKEDREDMTSPTSQGRQGRHVIPIFPDVLPNIPKCLL